MFKEYIEKATKDLNFKELSEIQNRVIPLALKNKDIIGQSQTGSGKTHAFLIPIFELLNEDLNEVQAVIIAPTRELAMQIFLSAQHIGSFSSKDIDIRIYTGGTDKLKEISRLKKSQPQIVIGTPGKINDLTIKENVLKVYTSKTFVIDEADMSMESGFLENLDAIIKTMYKKLQIMVFSATIPKQLEQFLTKYLKNPVFIKIKPNEITNINIEHILIPTKNKSKNKLLLQLMDIINPFVALIFANTKEKVNEIARFLNENGYKVAVIHGGISPRERKSIMKKINNMDFQYIVASDIASRGIDIDGVSHVINYELPSDIEFYIHRTGRTGRINYSGVAISFYDIKENNYVSLLENKGISIKYKIIKNNELVNTTVFNARQKREFIEKNDTLEAKLKVKKNNKKVKPGYKKKYNKELERAKKKVRRTKR